MRPLSLRPRRAPAQNRTAVSALPRRSTSTVRQEQLEPTTGIEPMYPRYKLGVLPLNYVGGGGENGDRTRHALGASENSTLVASPSVDEWGVEPQLPQCECGVLPLTLQARGGADGSRTRVPRLPASCPPAGRRPLGSERWTRQESNLFLPPCHRGTRPVSFASFACTALWQLAHSRMHLATSFTNRENFLL